MYSRKVHLKKHDYDCCVHACKIKENGFSEKKAKFNRNSCTDEDALGRFRKRNVTIGIGIYV